MDLIGIVLSTTLSCIIHISVIQPASATSAQVKDVMFTSAAKRLKILILINRDCSRNETTFFSQQKQVTMHTHTNTNNRVQNC